MEFETSILRKINTKLGSTYESIDKAIPNIDFDNLHDFTTEELNWLKSKLDVTEKRNKERREKIDNHIALTKPLTREELEKLEKLEELEVKSDELEEGETKQTIAIGDKPLLMTKSLEDVAKEHEEEVPLKDKRKKKKTQEILLEEHFEPEEEEEEGKNIKSGKEEEEEFIGNLILEDLLDAPNKRKKIKSLNDINLRSLQQTIRKNILTGLTEEEVAKYDKMITEELAARELERMPSGLRKNFLLAAQWFKDLKPVIWIRNKIWKPTLQVAKETRESLDKLGTKKEIEVTTFGKVLRRVSGRTVKMGEKIEKAGLTVENAEEMQKRFIKAGFGPTIAGLLVTIIILASLSLIIAVEVDKSRNPEKYKELKREYKEAGLTNDKKKSRR